MVGGLSLRENKFLADEIGNIFVLFKIKPHLGIYVKEMSNSI